MAPSIVSRFVIVIRLHPAKRKRGEGSRTGIHRTLQRQPPSPPSPPLSPPPPPPLQPSPISRTDTHPPPPPPVLFLYPIHSLFSLSLSLRFPFPSPSFLPPSYPRSSARNRPIPMTMMTLQNREREGGRDAMTGVASASTMTRLWMSSRRTMTGARGCRANGELPMMTVE